MGRGCGGWRAVGGDFENRHRVPRRWNAEVVAKGGGGHSQGIDETPSESNGVEEGRSQLAGSGVVEGGDSPCSRRSEGEQNFLHGRLIRVATANRWTRSSSNQPASGRLFRGRWIKAFAGIRTNFCPKELQPCRCFADESFNRKSATAHEERKETAAQRGGSVGFRLTPYFQKHAPCR